MEKRAGDVWKRGWIRSCGYIPIEERFLERGRYAVMDPEEDELFGDDDDEEVAPAAV